MSLQADIEAELSALLVGSIAGLVVHTGPITTPTIEGTARAASVRRVSGDGTRLDHAQTEWAESFALTVYWSATISRADVITEWEAFTAALLADPKLSDTIQGLEQAYLSSTAWGEATDASMRTMTADITIERVE